MVISINQPELTLLSRYFFILALRRSKLSVPEKISMTKFGAKLTNLSFSSFHPKEK